MATRSPKLMQRLDKCVSHLTGMSRQQAAKAIKAGDVTVDGEVLTDAAQKISIESQIIILGYNDDQDEATSAQDAFKSRVFMINKPYDFICADRDKNYRLVVGLFNTELKSEQLHCAGRLDVDTTGLLIVTDDGDLNHQITSPKKDVSKLYYAVLEQTVPESAVKQFANGIKHPEETKRYQPAHLVLLPDDSQGRHIACVQLTEGRYHEVKRLFEVVGCEVKHLARLAIGKLTLGDLKIGAYQALTSEQVDLLFAEHEYSAQECLALILAHEKALTTGPYTFVPEEYRSQILTSLKAGDDAANNNLDTSNASSLSASVVTGAITSAALANANDACSDESNTSANGEIDTNTDAEANMDADSFEEDPYFDENLDAELDELYGDASDMDDEFDEEYEE